MVISMAPPALPGVASKSVPDWIRQLVVGADSYRIRRISPDGSASHSVIAGFPWFGDWGRDTMIALPGLTLATGQVDIAREILATFAGFVSEGMLPNDFPGEGGTPEYNTVDAALWFIEAWRAYYQASGDVAALREFLPVLHGIIRAYREGTRYGIAPEELEGVDGERYDADDGGSEWNAQLVYTPPADGIIAIEPRGFGPASDGAYLLTVAPLSPTE